MSHPLSTILTGVLTAVVLAACGSDASPVSDRVTSPTPVTSNGAASGELDIHGAWELTQSEADLRSALEEAGYAEHADAFIREEDIEGAQTQLLTVKGDRFAFAYLTGDQPWHVGWKGPAAITADTITLTDAFTGSKDELRWTVDGDELRFEVLQGAPGSFKGIPNEAYLAAYLTAAPFTRTQCDPADEHCDL
jgi:hypothetical protein